MKYKSNSLRNVILTAIFIPLIAIIIIFICADCEPKEITDITAISVDEIGEDYKPYYIEQLQILERYAFKTVDSYESTDGYSDDTYYAHRGDEPMDEYELFTEYYIVLFQDKSENPYLASMSVSSEAEMSELLNSTDGTLVIPACVSISSQKPNETFLNNYDLKILDMKCEKLQEYSQKLDIPNKSLNMVYKYETIDEYYENE